MGDGYVGRSLPGLPVFWNIVDAISDDPDTAEDETTASVGSIIAITDATGGAISTDGLQALALTDPTGQSTATITSSAPGSTRLTAIADYLDNPYPNKLYSPAAAGGWYEQPEANGQGVTQWVGF